MAVTVKSITLWRRDLENRPGALATVLQPVADAGADLQVAMGYRIPGDERRAVVELAPVTGGRARRAAENAGLSPSEIPTLLVEGDNRPGLGHSLAAELGSAGVNMAFLVAQVVGRRYSAVFGFENARDAQAAAAIIKRVSAAPRRRPSGRKRASRGSRRTTRRR
jgi:hypothetical protein